METLSLMMSSGTAELFTGNHLQDTSGTAALLKILVSNELNLEAASQEHGSQVSLRRPCSLGTRHSKTLPTSTTESLRHLHQKCNSKAEVLNPEQFYFLVNTLV